MESICTLIDYHLGEAEISDRSWIVLESKISGRGVFAVRDIKPDEIIFRERPLLIGPTAGKDSNLNICSVCQIIIDGRQYVCPRGCSLPICESCLDSEQHVSECNLYKSWEPIDPGQVCRAALRALVIVRGLFLNETQKQLVYELQANQEPTYQKEISSVALNFQKFPVSVDILEYFFRIVCVLNTNAFEALSQSAKEETSLRGLYPLSGIMNHECTPNTCHFFEDKNLMVVKSTRFIPKGSEITTTYTKILWSNFSRRVFLKMTKQFICSCSRCSDPTENGSYLSALLCRNGDCLGWIIPQDCSMMMSDWKCMKCGTTFDQRHVSKTQEFALRILNGKTSTGSIPDIIDFIREKASRVCPPTSQFIIELKLHVIWKITKSNAKFSVQQLNDAIGYCKDILNILEKLNAGRCTLKNLLEGEITNLEGML